MKHTTSSLFHMGMHRSAGFADGDDDMRLLGIYVMNFKPRTRVIRSALPGARIYVYIVYHISVLMDPHQVDKGHQTHAHWAEIHFNCVTKYSLLLLRISLRIPCTG